MPIHGTANISRVSRMVWLNPGISRIEIARKLDLDKSTITNIISRLIRQRIILPLEEGDAGPRGGRRPIGLSVNGRFGLILGLEITTDKVQAVGMNLHGRMVFMRKIVLEEAPASLGAVFQETLKKLDDDIRSAALPLIGIGIGVSGIVNAREGIIYQSNPLDIRQPVAFYDEISGTVPVPVFIENDANCCCWEEMVCTSRERQPNFIFVLAEDRFHKVNRSDGRIGFAVGLGIVVNGTLIRGNDYSAGEFQSIFWKQGNLSQFSIDDGVMMHFDQHPEAIATAVQELAANVAFLANSLDVSKVVLGGGIEKYGSKVVNAIQQAIEANWSYPNQITCDVHLNEAGEYVVAAGAAAMFLEKLFSLPPLQVETAEEDPAELVGYDLFESLRHTGSEKN
jgi:predicted NBD/HSP70 family sugar kinase